MRYNTVLFDFDGTLADSSSIILPCIKNAYEHLGMELPDISILHKFIGPPLQEVVPDHRDAGGTGGQGGGDIPRHIQQQ